MKRLITICLIVGMVFAVSSMAQAVVIYTFDENGDSTLPYGTDETLNNALYYAFRNATWSDGVSTPAPVPAGDVALMKPGCSIGSTDISDISDVLRFTNTTVDYHGHEVTEVRIYVYSGDGGSDLADVVGIPELGSPAYVYDGWGDITYKVGGVDHVAYGVTYVPSDSSQPGWLDEAGITYNLIPEPATIGLLGLGALSLIRKRRA